MMVLSVPCGSCVDPALYFLFIPCPRLDGPVVRRINSSVRRLELGFRWVLSGTYLLSIRTNDGNLAPTPVHSGIMRLQATIRHGSVNRILYTDTTMERTRPADRSNLIRLSMVLFSVLAVVSFALAKVSW